MNKQNRQHDLLQIISNLDISPTLFKNATEKYQNLAKYLQFHGLQADMYPQGSFTLGTVIRPFKKNNMGYDLDFICQIKGNRDTINPSNLRNKIKKVLKSSDLYGGKLQIWDECFTIEYSNISGFNFSIDIVPAVDESITNKLNLLALSHHPNLLNTAIVIPKCNNQKIYRWITSNPKGYIQWFQEINEPFKNVIENEYRNELYHQYNELYSSIEEIPSDMIRTPLQRVIQILKRHRDIFYSRIENGNDIKPISAIINTLVANIAINVDPHISVFEFLNYVVNELSIYSNHMVMSEISFESIHPNNHIITKTNGKWKIENPANPKDNLADKWNSDNRIPKTFFKWISKVKEQLIDSLKFSNDQAFRSSIENAFGYEIVNHEWQNKYINQAPKPLSTTNISKPWRRK